MKVAFIGLGVMGYPMAGWLAKNRHQVTVYNRTASKAGQWLVEHRQHQASLAATPAIAAQDAELVFCCVGNDDDVRAVTLGEEGAFSAMKTGALFVDHTTTSAQLARELATAASEQGFGFLDAPVSGGQAGAENGQLTVMVGGEQADFDRAEPVMQHYAKAVTLMGPVGNGQLTKMVNQICVAGLVQGLSEGLAFAQAAGLDGEKVVREVISKGAAQSWQMENRYQTMLAGEFDFGFAVDWMRKDLAIVMAEAEAKGLELPITQLVDQYYAEVQAMGGGRWDTSSLIARLRSE